MRAAVPLIFRKAEQLIYKLIPLLANTVCVWSVPKSLNAQMLAHPFL